MFSKILSLLLLVVNLKLRSAFKVASLFYLGVIKFDISSYMEFDSIMSAEFLSFMSSGMS